jgi:hypothetical protein
LQTPNEIIDEIKIKVDNKRELLCCILCLKKKQAYRIAENSRRI